MDTLRLFHVSPEDPRLDDPEIRECEHPTCDLAGTREAMVRINETWACPRHGSRPSPRALREAFQELPEDDVRVTAFFVLARDGDIPLETCEAAVMLLHLQGLLQATPSLSEEAGATHA